jgi:hypothetical protein
VKTTPANGTFTFPGIGTAYDIAAALGSVEAVEYVGVTRSDPILVLPMSAPAGSKMATINLSGSPLLPAGSSWTAAWLPPGTSEIYAAAYYTGSASPSLPFQWANARSTVNGTAVGFERDGSGVFTRFGSVSGVAATDTQTTSLAIPMTSISAGTVTGTASRSSTQQFWWSTSVAAEIGGARIPIAGGTSMPEGSFSLSTPKGTGYNLRVVGFASDSSSGSSETCKSILPDAAGVNITVPLGPIQTGPATNATGVNGSTVFGWSTVGASVYRLQLGSLTYRVAIYTSANNATIPDLSAMGFTLPATNASTWQVVSAIPALGTIGPTVDDTAAGPWSIDCNSTRAVTAPRSFTTQ